MTFINGRGATRDHNPQVDDLVTQAFLDLGDLERALEIARDARNGQGGVNLSPDVVRQLARVGSRSGVASRTLGLLTKETSPVLRIACSQS